MNLAPGSKLGPYEILAPIGAGGMGEVWKAHDPRLNRTVAIKKVKAQHSERFKREAQSIAALNHPNICQIFDIGPDYLVLEYVDGKPLSSPLPEQEAVHLAIQIASALEAAHKKGIIHRDLKPSNIMVTDEGSVKLLDFGLAKLYEQDASISILSTADMPATEAGAILGTVAYMSPEQAQGKPADARSDIFSFGLVLYEILSGKRAFSGESNYAVMDAIVRKDPPPLQTSPPLEGILKRCLEKQPSARYQTMSAVKTELEKILEENQSKTSVESQASIAVLPFADMSSGKDNEWFSDGLAEEIINALTQIPGLKVIARTSAFAFKGKEQDIRRIAGALSVSNILEGSVRKVGDRIRITAQLINASDGSHLWSERYDRDMTDVFAIQDEISQAIAKKFRVRVSGDRPLIKRHTENVEAYNLYLKGHYHLSKTAPEHMAKGKEYYEQAVAMDPNYAQAWCGLATFYWGMGLSGIMPPKVANVQSRQAVTKALELAETLPEAHGIIAVLQACDFDWSDAEREFIRALELGPEGPDVWSLYSAFYLVPMRRFDEAVSAAKRALELDPLSPSSHLQVGLRYFQMRQYDQAMQEYRNALELDPYYHLAHVHSGTIYLHTGKLDEAIRSIESIPPHFPSVSATRGLIYARAGRIVESQRILKDLLERTHKGYVPPIAFVIMYVGLGEIDKALDWLDKAVDERDPMILPTIFAPVFDPLSTHPRYKALLRKMNLEP